MFIQRYNNDSRVFAALQVLTLLLRVNIVVPEGNELLRARGLIWGGDLSGGRSICRAILVLAFPLVVRNGCCEPSGNFLKTISEGASLARWTSSLVLRYSCCFKRSRNTYRIIAQQYARESATKRREKNSVRNLETSWHPWLNMLLIDYRYPPTITLTLVPRNHWKYIRDCAHYWKLLRFKSSLLYVILLLILMPLLIRNVVEWSLQNMSVDRGYQDLRRSFSTRDTSAMWTTANSRDSIANDQGMIRNERRQTGHLRTDLFCRNFRSLSNRNENLWQRDSREDFGPICAFFFPFNRLWLLTAIVANTLYEVFPAAPGRLALFLLATENSVKISFFFALLRL